MTSEARLPLNSQYWTKSLSFHDSGLSGQLNFDWPDWKPLGLNYSNVHVGQKHPFTQKIRSLAQKRAILVFRAFKKMHSLTLHYKIHSWTYIPLWKSQSNSNWTRSWNWVIIITIRVIQSERFSTESAKTKLSYKYLIMDSEWFGPILH